MVSYVLRHRDRLMIVMSRIDVTLVGDLSLKVHATSSLDIIVCYYLSVGRVLGSSVETALAFKCSRRAPIPNQWSP